MGSIKQYNFLTEITKLEGTELVGTMKVPWTLQKYVRKKKSNQAVRIVRVKFELCDVITEGVPVPSEQVGVPHIPKQDEGIVHNLESKQKIK